MIDAMLRVLLVEDHPIVRLGLATVVNAQDDMSVVAEVGLAEDALSAVIDTEPSLIILPLRLGGAEGGLELCREIKSLAAAPPVLLYTSFNSPSDATLAFMSGADSFLTKDHPKNRLLETIRATASGQRIWAASAEAASDAHALDLHMKGSLLTSREKEVLGFMLQRYTNAEISRELFISVPTVKTHVSNVLQKLGIESRKALFSERNTPPRSVFDEV